MFMESKAGGQICYRVNLISKSYIEHDPSMAMLIHLIITLSIL